MGKNEQARHKGAGYPLGFEFRVVSGGLGTANHVGAGDGLCEEPLIGLGFWLLFANAKVTNEEAILITLQICIYADTQCRAQGNSID